MKIAINHRSGSFSERWIEYCEECKIPFKIVNCYDSDIIEQLKDCDALMWHHHHGIYKDVLTAKRILFALEHAGIKVFPNFHTAWHFDDKVGQKYLLEAIGAPLVPSFVFYDKESALNWAKNTKYPKVFKLRGGAAGANVSLIKNKREACHKINTAFGKGFSQFNGIRHLKERYRKYKLGKDTLIGVFRGVYRAIIPTLFARMHAREKGYVYFQEFIPNNDYDTRVIVIGERAFAITRGVRKGDFRASGSGDISYNHSAINLDIIRLSFEVNKCIQSQCIAFDYVVFNGKPLVVEISYGFAIAAYDLCPGYWTSDLIWHEGNFNPQAWLLRDLLGLK